MTAFDRTDTGSELNLASPSKAASLARSGVYLTQGYDALILADRFRSHTLCSLAIPISLGQAMRTLFEKFRDMGGLTCDILLSRDLSDHTDVHEYVEDLMGMILKGLEDSPTWTVNCRSSMLSDVASTNPNKYSTAYRAVCRTTSLRCQILV